ncbi:MAG: DUF4259 domain-containing protein [Actinobacteria bacterium]|nr:DUF4259 domain-containing protein [Actinomycetota bacterium]
MGTWGVGVYDNDGAADWAGGVPSGGLKAIERAIDAVLATEYIDSYDAECALVAADVVARLVSGHGEDSPYCEDIVAWVSTQPGLPSAELVAKGAHAVQRIGGEESELAELRSENASHVSAWRATLADVAERLSA